MLGENIKTLRKAKGLSQQALADRLHIVRQTVSKWEQGRSVPDAEMLCALSDVLDTSVARLLGEMPAAPTSDDCQAMAATLGQMQLQLAQRQARRRRLLRLAFACGGSHFCMLMGLSKPLSELGLQRP